METIKYPSKEQWAELQKRPVLDYSTLYGKVQAILDDVKNNDDKAIKKYTKEFDKVEIDA